MSSAATPSLETSPQLLLQLAAITKKFGPLIANDAIDLDVHKGEIVALLGENGAGKSTLMKILSGVHKPDEGSILLDGSPFNPSNPHHARMCGIAMIYQELNLAPDLSVMENITLGDEPSALGWRRISEQKARATEALQQLEHEQLPLDIPVNRVANEPARPSHAHVCPRDVLGNEQHLCLKDGGSIRCSSLLVPLELAP